MKYKTYEIAVVESEPGTWRATIRRTDGRPITCKGTTLPQFTIEGVANAEYATQLAMNAIDTGSLT